MARVEVAAHAGACFGVQRALKLVMGAAAKGPVRTLGPLIHNPRVVHELQELGVGQIENPGDCPQGFSLALRAHGVTAKVERDAESRGLTLIDATCPFVRRVHRAARLLVSEGYDVLVLGEEGHAEVEGIVGHAEGCRVVGDASDLEGMTIKSKVGVVVQTTQIKAGLDELVNALTARCDEVRVFNTICDATSKRQGAALELARRADVMIVLGGRTSANTTHLAELCADVCKRTHHIEAAKELDASWFEEAELIGVTAGASTPEEHIAELMTTLQRWT